MIIDMHVHLADLDALFAASSSGARPRLNGYLTRAFRRGFAEPLRPEDHGSVNERWVRCLATWVKGSRLDRAVLLALDSVYDESGRSCPGKTTLHVENEFVRSVAARHPEFMFGASIHPYRHDAVDALERVIRQGACLIKWIPSGQHIEPDRPECFPFYEALAHYGIPLLSHTGVEHALGSRRSRYNHPKRLVPALERGVTVIAAHCGVHLFLHEPSFFASWASLAGRYENLYGDSGAFSIVTRIPSLRRILADDVLRSKLLYGSDYPGMPSPWWCWQLGCGTMRTLSQIANPLERNLRVMQSLGMPEEVLERAGGCLGAGTKECLSHEC